MADALTQNTTLQATYVDLLNVDARDVVAEAIKQNTTGLTGEVRPVTATISLATCYCFLTYGRAMRMRAPRSAQTPRFGLERGLPRGDVLIHAGDLTVRTGRGARCGEGLL